MLGISHLISRKVTKVDAEEFCKAHKLKYTEVSAKTGKKIG